MNSLARIFDNYAGDYDRWFDEHDDVYQAQAAYAPCSTAGFWSRA